jgi:hypothetical protein
MLKHKFAVLMVIVEAVMFWTDVHGGQVLHSFPHYANAMSQV